MQKIAHLQRTADLLRARIFRTLPWGARVAHAFTVLSNSTISTVGRAVGAVFLQRGVVGMPDPGPTWNPNAREPALTLPSTYYSTQIAAVFRKMVSSRRATPDTVEDALITATARLTAKPEYIAEGSPENKARAYFVTMVQSAFSRQQQTTRRALPPGAMSMHEVNDEGEEYTLDIEDPKSLEYFEELFPLHKMGPVNHDLKRIVDWAPEYWQMVLDGYSDREILGNPQQGVPGLLAEKLRLPYLANPKGQPMTLGMWSKSDGYKDKIEKVIRKHLADLH